MYHVFNEKQFLV